MNLQENISLKPYNTFGIDARAKYFTAFTTLPELAECLQWSRHVMGYGKEQTLILGGGSNILFTKDFPGLVLKNQLPGISKIAEDETNVYVKAGAGENWHQLVLYCINHGWGGVENLSLIPGSVGASPMQNIGAYGVELKDVFHSLQAFHIHDQKLVGFDAAACAFGYRESVFKSTLKNEFVITDVTFRLSKSPVLHTAYGAIEEELQAMGVKDPDIQSVSQAVINIRSSKLPDPAVTGNAGSFFKNPEINIASFVALQNNYPGIIGYPLPNGNIKLAAGWLIEQCGWKGYRKGDAGCHPKQALVLVNYGAATGNEIVRLSEEIIRGVYEKFAVLLSREVNLV
jgi:UDP-N-acetylmuramate dehydrogenase